MTPQEKPVDPKNCPCGVPVDAETHVEMGDGFTHVSKPVEETMGPETVVGEMVWYESTSIPGDDGERGPFQVTMEDLKPEFQALIREGAKVKALEEKVSTLKEAYEEFRMKPGGDFSFLVLAGMYLCPQELTESDKEWGLKMAAKLKADAALADKEGK